MQNNCIKDLLNFKDVEVKKIKNLKDSVEIYVELPKTTQYCPKCAFETSKVHDYRLQPIQDVPIQFKPTTIFYRKRRYECCVCGKRFYKKNELVGRFARKTNRFVGHVVNELRNLVSGSDIAKKCNTSSNFISRLVPYFAVSNSHLPRVLCIDEFKGNAGKYKYQVALIDGETHDVVDILECRHKHALCNILKSFLRINLIMLNILLLTCGKHIKILLSHILEKLKLLLTISIGLDMLVMLLIKLELKFKTHYQKKKEYILNILDDFFFLGVVT